MGSKGRPGVPGGLILGIESSCDETAAAVVRAGGEVLANVVASQIALHANFGGVVPELASREHLRNIVPVVQAAMAEAGLEFADLDAIAVTEGPGLAGALLVGITYAKALALGVGKPLIAVNHLEGHIHAVLMEANSVPPTLPAEGSGKGGAPDGDADAGAGGEWGAHASLSGGIQVEDESAKYGDSERSSE
jgi:tRNA A37 threonylcarbamoyltransferase TsaD